MKTYLAIFKRALVSFGKNQCTSFAAATSYYALFSLFPLIVFVISLLGYFVHSEQQRESVVNGIFALLGQSVDKNSLYTQVNAFAGGRGGLGLLGLVLALWSASAVFGAIRTGLNVAWGVTKSRPFVQTRLLDLGMVIGVGVLILLSLAATALLTAIEGFSAAMFGREFGALTHLLFALLFLVVPPAISFVAFAVTYYVVPHAEIRLKDVWLGSLVAAMLFQLAQIGFGVYAASFAHYDKIYGSLGAVIAFLFFIYISANILLFGGEVTKEYIDVKAGVKPPEDARPQEAPESLEQKALEAVKGLFMDESAHHYTSLPYEPARDLPVESGAPMARDEQAQPRANGAGADGSDGDHESRQPSSASERHS